MARSRASAIEPDLTEEETAAFDEMRAADSAPEQPENISEPAAEVDQEPQDDGAQQPKMVPHAALNEERERRRETEKRLADIEKSRDEDRQRFDERMSQILQRIGVPQQQQPAAPDAPPLPPVDQDPIGHFNAKFQQQDQILAALLSERQSQQQMSQQAQVEQAVRMRATAMGNEFAANTPDYNAAIAHLRAARERQLTNIGFLDAAERQQIMAQEAFMIAARAIQQNANPAERIYKAAQDFGYKPATAAAEAAPAEAIAAEQRLRTQQAGQQQSRSLGQARGGAAPPLSVDSILRMPESEFNAMLDKASPERLREIFGD